jgi:hypothetical protein
MTRKDQPNPILFEAAPADAVYTLNITAGFVKAGFNFMEVGPAFMEAHETLGINLKFDRKENVGWVTAEEARQIRLHMTASLTPVTA